MRPFIWKFFRFLWYALARYDADRLDRVRSAGVEFEAVDPLVTVQEFRLARWDFLQETLAVEVVLRKKDGSQSPPLMVGMTKEAVAQLRKALDLADLERDTRERTKQ